MTGLGARHRTFWLLPAAIAAALVAYSQTMALAWDEGFHIVTAQMILHGRKPYLDFCFSQTPFNAYWNAFWMAVLGESWRSAHAMEALAAAAGIALAAGFVLKRFPDAGWRLPGACLVSVLAGLNVIVVRYGTISQAYGLCVLLLTAAYGCCTAASEAGALLPAALAGLLSCGAAGSSLLTAPAAPVLLVWLILHSAPARRWRLAASFAAGGLLAFVPIFWLFGLGPQQVWFGIVDYNLRYRLVDWPPPDANRQNLEVAMTWIDCGPALVLLGLSAAGIRRAWRHPELKLCAWLSAGLGLYIATAVRPTFPQYFIFTVPFLAILAVAGIRSQWPEQRWLPVLLTSFLVIFGLGKQIYEERDSSRWSDFESIAEKVLQVTPPGGELYADEIIYFLTKHTPPSGMEEANSHKLDFAPEKLRLLHLIPAAELDRRVRAGVFATLETCQEEDYITEKGWGKLYGHRADVGGCTVFWGLTGRQ